MNYQELTSTYPLALHNYYSKKYLPRNRRVFPAPWHGMRPCRPGSDLEAQATSQPQSRQHKEKPKRRQSSMYFAKIR